MPSVSRRSLWLIAYGALAAVMLSAFLLQYPLPDAGGKLRSLGGFIFIFIGALGAGSLLFNITKLDADALWRAVFSTALGLGVLSLATLFLGWLPIGSLNGRLTFLQVIWGILFLFGLRHMRGTFKTTFGTMPFYSAIFLALTIAAGAVCFLSAFSPITYYDSLVYHLALPSYYLTEGRVAPAPFNLYSFFPANTEMLYLFALARLPEPEMVINLLTVGISALTAAALFGWLRSETDGKTGWTCVALWATMPAVMLLSVGGYVEIPLAFYSLLSLKSFANYLDTREKKWLFVSGLFSGFACATKYTGAITPIFLALYLLWLIVRRKEAMVKQAAGFCVAVLIPFAPWLVRNAVSIGNPFFPFFYKYLGGNIGWTQESAGAYFEMLTEYGAKSSVFFELLASPFKIALNSISFGGGFDVVGDFGWFLFILAAPVGMVLAWKSTRWRWLVVYLIFHFSFWFLTKPVLRFLVGVLPVAALFSAIAVRDLLKDRQAAVRVIASGFLGVVLLSNFFMYFFIAGVFKPFDVAIGDVDRETFLRRRLSFYPAFEFLNALPAEKTRALLIGEQRTHHLRVPYISASIFAPSPLANASNRAEGLSLLNAEIQQRGVTHIVLHTGEVERLGGLRNFGFSEGGQAVLADFLSSKCRLIYEQNSVLVYETTALKPS